MIDQDLNCPLLRDRAVMAARGDGAFDVLVAGGCVADVATGEVRAADVGLVGPLIASVHPRGARGDAARVIDATGGVVAPGLIDSHMHIESAMVTPHTYAAAIAQRGVTTLVWDPHEFANVAGDAGVDYARAAAAAAPVRILPQVPSCVPSAPGFETAGADFDAATIARLLADAPAGLAEVMDMAAVTARAPRMRAILQAALAAGRPVNGHARGLTGAGLQAYCAAGVTSDHEVTSAADLLEKLRAGLSVELRGSHAYLLPEFVEALSGLPQWPQTLTIATDDVFPDDLLASGGLDHVLSQLVALGMPSMAALQAATLNAARRLGRPDLGHIAPGRRADLVVFDDLKRFAARTVLIDGAAPVAGPAPAPPEGLSGSMRLPALSPEDFVLRADGAAVTLATIANPRFTAWGSVTAPVVAGAVQLPAGATMIAVAHRHGQRASTPALGVLTGWGDWRGAFATTVSHDSHNLTVFGRDPHDMAAAANALVGSGGGMAVAKDGAVVAHLALPVGGLVSDAPLERVAQGFADVRAAAGTIVDWAPPYLVFKALVGATLACNKGPHQTDLGIADPLGGRLLRSPIVGQGESASRDTASQ
ncbi:MAG: adenine deaminase C-terminal domain-containing protein [Pseudomonadota bacterium]